jgi:hypothetical protein
VSVFVEYDKLVGVPANPRLHRTAAGQLSGRR